MQCLWVIFRKTYGWHKKSDLIALSQFSLMTRLSRSVVCKVLKALLSKKIIGVDKNDNTQINSYRFNKDFDQWAGLTKKTTLLSKKTMTVDVLDNKVLSKKTHTKENIQKKLLQKKRVNLCDDDFWKEVRTLYTWLDIDEMIVKMKGYQLTPKGKKWKMTKGSVIRWLNNQDKPLEISKSTTPIEPFKVINRDGSIGEWDAKQK